ncbi:hypothetical protein [Streptomyces iranensis]|uniref:Purine-cytosine permease-like protein n=1 Tax=Streptomyces iranensis TaxID=576784 RepID=A0A061ACN8_9ACTN|nr:hypothetical protein [Streptomyces iranensis]MBP2067653.1 purine-cytosine permease-like protein [Streptomyces iranensis]CDR18211.1 predicted protein [Streptomyces iranensis]
MPAKTSGRRLFWNLFAGGGLTAAFLATLGAVLASQGDMSNPVAGVQPMVPAWLFILFAISAVGGTIANNINDFVAMLVVWAGPFGGVWIADAVMRRNTYDPVRLHAVKDGERGPYRGWRGWNMHGWAAMLGGVATSLLCVNTLGCAPSTSTLRTWLPRERRPALARTPPSRASTRPTPKDSTCTRTSIRSTDVSIASVP